MLLQRMRRYMCCTSRLSLIACLLEYEDVHHALRIWSKNNYWVPSSLKVKVNGLWHPGASKTQPWYDALLIISFLVVISMWFYLKYRHQRWTIIFSRGENRVGQCFWETMFFFLFNVNLCMCVCVWFLIVCLFLFVSYFSFVVLLFTLFILSLCFFFWCMIFLCDWITFPSPPWKKCNAYI